jgi:hypothetical protein
LTVLAETFSKYCGFRLRKKAISDAGQIAFQTPMINRHLIAIYRENIHDDSASYSVYVAHTVGSGRKSPARLAATLASPP